MKTLRLPPHRDRSLSKSLGKAYLIGAGPGCADLITVRGLKLLRRADVVIYDRLVARELLDEVRTDAEQIFVGKESGHHTLPQSAINELIVDHVRQGKQVVRLKGGDPFVFGRGGEEAQALHDAGLPFEIVPGISSALAVPAYAGIPVTHRGLSTAFAVVTGHECSGKSTSTTDWNALSRIPTLVVLMGLSNADCIAENLIAAGLAPTTPAAAISQGTTDQQQVITTTVIDLANAIAEAALPSPAILVIGEVAALADELAWFAPSGQASGFLSIAATPELRVAYG